MLLQNTIAAVYPKNYYLSFKSKQKCDEIKAFENIIDNFYEQHEGEQTEDLGLNIYSIWDNLTVSRFINRDENV